MGWIGYHKPVGEKAVDSIKEQCGAEWCSKYLVAATATREAVFLVAKSHDPDSKVYVPDADGTVRVLLVFAIRTSPKSYHNFSYKSMEETMGPYGYYAPMSIIAQCSALQDPIGPQPDYSQLTSVRNYRETLARVAAQKALKRGLKPGHKVTLAAPVSFGGVMLQRFTVERCRVRGRKARVSTVFRAENGMFCTISARALEGATIET